MKKIDLPKISFDKCYKCCADSVTDDLLSERFLKAQVDLASQSKKYRKKAIACELFDIVPLDISDDKNPVVVLDLTKDELVSLYSDVMTKHKTPRELYNTIKTSTDGYCPLCFDIGQVTNLEHYLPKSKFPQFSVTPYNLIPSCWDCNFFKRAKNATEVKNLPIHPYFDKDIFFEDEWLKASLHWKNKPTILYHAEPPEDWSVEDKLRVQNHLVLSGLDDKFSHVAGQELVTVIDQRKEFMKNLSSSNFKQQLIGRLSSSVKDVNHWRHVMYKCLADNQEFLDKDFNEE